MYSAADFCAGRARHSLSSRRSARYVSAPTRSRTLHCPEVPAIHVGPRTSRGWGLAGRPELKALVRVWGGEHSDRFFTELAYDPCRKGMARGPLYAPAIKAALRTCPVPPPQHPRRGGVGVGAVSADGGWFSLNRRRISLPQMRTENYDYTGTHRAKKKQDSH
jgi:hypothetical protein